MLASVSIRKLGFAERMTRALELFNVQRMAEQDARAKELQLWANLFQAVFRTTEQALKSNIEAEPSHTNRRCDSLGMGDDDGAVNFRRGDHGEHGDREAMGSEGTIREAGSPGLRAPPGLQPSEPHHWIPRETWKTMDDAERYLAYLDSRRRRQKDRRARTKRCATAEQDAPYQSNP